MPEPPRVRFKMPELPRFTFKMPELSQFKMPHIALPRFDGKLTRRRKRYAVLAATVMLAAGLGAIIGAAASGGFAHPAAPQDVAGLKERQAMQQIIARLTKDIGALKASVAASKTAQRHVAMTSEKIIAKLAAKPAEKIASKAVETPAPQASPQITGSIPTRSAPGAAPGWSRNPGAPASGEGLVDPHRARRLRLCARPRRRLRGRARRALAQPWSGEVDQTAGWALGGGDPEGAICRQARPQVLRIAYERCAQNSGARFGRRFAFMRLVICA